MYDKASARLIKKGLRELQLQKPGSVHAYYVQLCEAWGDQDMEDVRELLDELMQQASKQAGNGPPTTA